MPPYRNNSSASEPSDEIYTSLSVETSSTSITRRRSSRACDQCRRTKSKCEPALTVNSCQSCLALSISCTYASPSHKRGPPKGYILALERRLHQVEALLGTIIGSNDPRARSLIEDLCQDQMADHIIHRVKIGPFGPKSRVHQPFGSTKEDFLESIMMGAINEQPPLNSLCSENLALISPDRDWQNRLHDMLYLKSTSHAREGSNNHQHNPSAAHIGALGFGPTHFPITKPSSSAYSIPAAGNQIPLTYEAKIESPLPSTASAVPHFASLSGLNLERFQRMPDTESISSDGSDTQTTISPVDPPNISAFDKSAFDTLPHHLSHQPEDLTRQWYFTQVEAVTR